MKQNVHSFDEFLNEEVGCGNNPIADTPGLHPGQEDEYTPDMYGGTGICSECGGDNTSCDHIGKNYGIGDLVRNVHEKCPDYGTTGRVIDVGPKKIAYIVVSGPANAHPGQILMKPRNTLTIDEKYKVVKENGCRY